MAGNSYLLDTNAIIALQKNEASIIALLEAAGEVFVPSIASVIGPVIQKRPKKRVRKDTAIPICLLNSLKRFSGRWECSSIMMNLTDRFPADRSTPGNAPRITIQ